MFAFTRTERQAILFLACVALAGIGLNMLIKKSCVDRAITSFPEDLAKIDLNRADKDLLMSVPGIKGKTAQRILDYRREKSGFSDERELESIRGIGRVKFEKIKDYFIVK